MLKFRHFFILLIVLSLLMPAVVSAATPSKQTYIHTDLEKGIVWTSYESSNKQPVKIRISKDGTSYTYDATSFNHFPLQLGNGTYQIVIFEHVYGGKYRLVEQKTVNYAPENPERVYLQSVQNIEWNDTMKAVIKAAELTKDAKTDEEKIIAIYDYITQNIAYDNEKAQTVQSGYIPSVEDTFEMQKGICYDYATLFAAMMRSVGIPTKLLMGQKEDIDVYHAWNEVYLKDTQQWITVDTTYDAALIQGGQKDVEMIKDAAGFKVEKQY